MAERHIFRCMRPDVEIPVVPLTNYVTERFDAVLDKNAFITPEGRQVTFAQLRAGINRASHGLRELGVRFDDVVGLHLPNIPEFVVAFQAIANAGAIVTTSNPLYGPSELSHQWRETGCRFVLTLPMFKEVTEAAAKEAPTVEKVFYLGEEPTFLQCTNDAPFDAPEFDPRTKLVVIPFSSGTSGLPKGVELTHHNLVANIHELTADPEFNLDIRPTDTVLGLLPLFHIFGMVCICSVALRVGTTTVLMPKFDPVQFLTLSQTHRISFVPLVPPVLLFLAKHPSVERFDLSSFRVLFSGAAPLDGDLTRLAADRLKCSVTQGFGMTELSPGALISMPGFAAPGSCGRVIPNTECMIVDIETGRSLPAGLEHRGELWVRGPQAMRGYRNNPTATAEILDAEGWIHTGDIASVDEHGNFFIVDRLKELIKVKGFQVAPAELEALLIEFPEVADAAVIGVMSEREGEVPKAYVVLQPGASLTEAEILKRVEERVTSFKQLKGGVEFTDKIPKSASGKILRRILKDQEKARAAAAAAAAAAAPTAAGGGGAGGSD